MAYINIQGNTFHHGSSVFGQYTENNYGWNDAAKELSEIQEKLDDIGSLKQAVEELGAMIREQNTQRTKQTLTKYIADFTSATFANLASAGLLRFLGLPM